MNIVKSIYCRYLNYKVSHFERFVEGAYLRTLKDKHSGRRCFIVGNGPSLDASDLTKIGQVGDISFAFNRIYHIFKNTDWRPTYYISQDEKILAGCKNEVEAIKAKGLFIPIELKWYYGIDIHVAKYFHIVTDNMNEEPLFSEDISKCVFNSRTVVYSAIQFAVYMGIREIYLIGVDHHFHTSMNSKGEIVVDPKAKDYFSAEYNNDKENLYVPNTDLSTLAFLSAKKYADAHGIKIYNATRGGMLEVFPRVNFDSLFKF